MSQSVIDQLIEFNNLAIRFDKKPHKSLKDLKRVIKKLYDLGNVDFSEIDKIFEELIKGEK